MWAGPFAIISSFVFTVLAISPAALDCSPVPSPSDYWVEFETFDKGHISYIGYAEMNYKGEYIVIRDQDAWASFWVEHTRGIIPKPPVPTNISWDSDMVLVAILGTVRNCCEAYIEFTSAYREGDNLTAYVKKVDINGMMPAVMNPYHIIVIEKVPNVHFRDHLFDFGGAPSLGVSGTSSGHERTESTYTTPRQSLFEEPLK